MLHNFQQTDMYKKNVAVSCVGGPIAIQHDTQEVGSHT